MTPSWLVATALLFPGAVSAQIFTRPTAPMNTAFLEAFGNGGTASANYERAVTPILRLRVGWGSWEDHHSTAFDDVDKSYTAVPILLQAVLDPTAEYHLELGGGVLLGSESVDSIAFGSGASSYSHQITNLEGLLGYRRQPPGGGFVARAGITPSYAMSGDYPDRGFHVGLGVSVGWSF